MNLTVKIAGPEEAGLIAEMSRETFYETFAPYNTTENMDRFMYEQFSVEKLMKEVEAPGNTFLLAYDDNKPAGYVRMREGEDLPELKNKKSIEIARIYVMSSYFGKGVGKLLLDKCLDLASEMNKEVIWLGVWENNARAISFYQKCGFTKFGEHEFVLGDDHQNDWLMKKEL